MEKEPEGAPPFYKALKKFATRKTSSWSTPGHSFGSNLEHTPLGRDFKKFYGKNIFATDISSSMAEMGSILEHQGPSDEAEKAAASIFNADTTFFVLNGTSTANKIVFFATVAPSDIVLLGRTCHKSIIHSVIMNEALPVYLKPLTNKYGILGPIPRSEFDRHSVLTKIKNCPIIKRKKVTSVQLSAITNSTYDGFLYNAVQVSYDLAKLSRFILFDEAWFAYGAFHPFYEKRYALTPYTKKRGKFMPPIFATQSTHKLLFAFSQGSMLHFRQGDSKKIFDIQGLVEANLMHASTSPFYPLFASLDVSAHIMRSSGYSLIDDSLKEALHFRTLIAQKYISSIKNKSWFFRPYQPDVKRLTKDPALWSLKPNQKWHGFEISSDDDVILDPLKVTLLTSDFGENAQENTFNIPAIILGKFLRKVGITPEKTGLYNILFLFAPGVTRKKTRALYACLQEFKKLYDANAPLAEVFEDIAPYYLPNTGLKDLCVQMHEFIKNNEMLKLFSSIYDDPPEQALAPHRAYYALVEGRTEYLPLEEISGRISVFTVLPYPPGIPFIMPGERFPEQESPIVKYLKASEMFDNIFKGFDHEFHGIKRVWEFGKARYYISCFKKDLRLNSRPHHF